jgi:hypothetical protein
MFSGEWFLQRPSGFEIDRTPWHKNSEAEDDDKVSLYTGPEMPDPHG